MKEIEISIILWIKLIQGLKRRGKGKKESGAFLLSKPLHKKVFKIVFYDQFDKNVSDSGIIKFKGASLFYEFLALNKLEIIADIHTHPSNDTNQSSSDKNNPMVRIPGHTALIAPNYAKDLFIRPSNCSVYEYQGNFKWKKYNKNNSPITIKLI